MTDDSRYARLFEIVKGARLLCGAELEAYLNEACGTDEALRAEVRALHAAGSDGDARDGFSEEEIRGARQGLEVLVDDTANTWLPERVGDYRILRQLGQGGMGVVYEAQQESPRRRVALKLLHPMHATPDRLRRFRQEAQLLGRLHHPGIAQIFEASTYDVGRGPQPFFAMELVHGVDIRTHCQRQGLDPAARIELLARVADAAHYAHERGIVHRDLKPDNVLVDESGQPRILDFGIARANSQSATLSTFMTEEGQIVGTLAYMAPEQLNHSGQEVTPRCDVYALGILGFELLVGRLPLEIDDLSISRAIALLATTDPPRAGELDPTLKGDIETILGKALESDPERRYESAAALAADMRRYLTHRPVLARPPSRIYLAKKFTRRHRGLVAGTLTTLLALIIGTIVAVYLAGQAQDQRDVATHNEARAVASETRAINGLVQSAQVLIDAGRGRDALDQLRVVPEDRRGVAWRMLKRQVPHVIDMSPGSVLFMGDDHLVGLRDGGLCLYSIPEQRIVRECFQGTSILRIEQVASCGVVLANTATEDLRLDLVRGVELGRSLIKNASDGVHANRRIPEISDDGRTALSYPTPYIAEVMVDGEVVRSVQLGPTEAAHLGPDGRWFVVNRRSSVTAFDLLTEDPVYSVACEEGDRASGFPVRGGLVLVSGPERCRTSGLRVWTRVALDEPGDIPTGDPFASGLVAPAQTETLYSFGCPADGAFLAVTGETSAGAYLADPRTGAPLIFAGTTGENITNGRAGFLPFREYPISKVDVAPSGNRLVIYSSYGQPEVVELAPRSNEPGFDARSLVLAGHEEWIYHLAVSNTGRWIASAAPLDPMIRVWDSETGECVAQLERRCVEPGSWNALMVFVPEDDRLLMTTPMTGDEVCLVDWEFGTGEFVTTVPALRSEAGGESARTLRGFDGHLGWIDALVERLPPGDQRLNQHVQMNGDEALVAYSPALPSEWKVERSPVGARWRYVPGVEDLSYGLSVHPTEALAAVAQQQGGLQGPNQGVSRRGQVLIVDTLDGEVMAQINLAFRPWCLAYSPDGSVLAVGTNEGRVLFFETDGLTQQLEWKAHDSYVYSLAWTPDGTRLVTASGDRTLRVWDSRPL